MIDSGKAETLMWSQRNFKKRVIERKGGEFPAGGGANISASSANKQ